VDVVSASDPSFAVGPTPTAAKPSATPYATVTPAIESGSYAALTYSGTGANLVTFSPNTAPVPSATGLNGICQTFVVPANGVLTAYVNEGASDTNSSTKTYFDQEADIFQGGLTNGVPSGSPINLFMDAATQAPTTASGDLASTGNAGVYQLKTFNLTQSPYNLVAGQTVTVLFGTFESSPTNRYGAYMFVDQVAVSGNPTPANGMARIRHPAHFTTR
jgi:hypothetical protein